MGNRDIQKHIGNCTDNYLLIENGEFWDMKKEAENYRANVHRVMVRKDNFDFKYVRVYGNIAYAIYNLKSVIIENGNVKNKNWNESVIFRKIDSKWKIELIHSTPISTN